MTFLWLGVVGVMSPLLAAEREWEVPWQEAARVLTPEVIAITDSVQTMYDSLGVNSHCVAAEMPTDWFHEDRWDPPWAGVIRFDENQEEPIWSWLQDRGWEQRNGSDGPCSSSVVWTYAQFGCVLRTEWSPCLGLNEFTAAQEDSVYAAEGSSFDFTISFCVVDTVKVVSSRQTPN